ncbi:MAG TPA: alpha/beta hydrolase [Candidatus Moranbacteria bacterium]|nr:MAG: Dipeptidylaminopeptidase/acylaminoacyl-peptidase [Candidatus Moranbacteria bacterium GW2011_GWF1_34_10]HBI17474.1 alpha/beta hydrolase [Candidatus Moranbacteria bacterium]
MKNIFRLIIVLGLFTGLILVIVKFDKSKENQPTPNPLTYPETKTETEKSEKKKPSPMEIEELRKGNYPGGDFEIEESLPNGTNYRQMIVSYKSEGLKIYGLLTVPLEPKPEGGYPAIIFMHGYIPPKQYSTTGNYPTYQATLARSGMITFKPDLRGHGQSEGNADGAHFSEKYVIDTLYAISYLKNYPEVNSEKIGYWGHSNGGEIGLRTITISPDIKAAVFWAGVVGSFQDMLHTYNAKIPFLQNLKENSFIKEHGLPDENPDFWKKIDPHFYLRYISSPIQLHHGTKDKSVPVELSLRLKKELEKAQKNVEYFEYTGDDHNLSQNYSLAWERTITFFKENL